MVVHAIEVESPAAGRAEAASHARSPAPAGSVAGARRFSPADFCESSPPLCEDLLAEAPVSAAREPQRV